MVVIGGSVGPPFFCPGILASEGIPDVELIVSRRQTSSCQASEYVGWFKVSGKSAVRC